VRGEGGTLSFVYENDIFSNRDSHYTSGARVSWIPESDEVPGWIQSLAHAVPWVPREGVMLHGYSIGQNIYTPTDISLANPPEEERPYAGWLYGTAGVAVANDMRLDQVVLTVGIVGPASLAERTQKVVHKILDSDEPMGWDTQLRNEPGLMLSWQRNWRAWVQGTLAGNQLDITPHLGATLGNVYTYANSGITIRYGDNLPIDFGPPRIQPGITGTSSFVPRPGFGWYLFAGIEGRAIARNIFLDGNSFRNSRSVDKKNFVGDVQFGAVVVWERVRLSYTHVLRTHEFDTQEKSDSFGSITLTVQY